MDQQARTISAHAHAVSVPIREAREEVGVDIAIQSLLCVTEHRLPAERQHWISPAFLAQVLHGSPSNCEPEKTQEVRWFPFDALPPNLTQTRPCVRTAPPTTPIFSSVYFTILWITRGWGAGSPLLPLPHSRRPR